MKEYVNLCSRTCFKILSTQPLGRVASQLPVSDWPVTGGELRKIENGDSAGCPALCVIEEIDTVGGNGEGGQNSRKLLAVKLGLGCGDGEGVGEVCAGYGESRWRWRGERTCHRCAA